MSCGGHEPYLNSRTQVNQSGRPGLVVELWPLWSRFARQVDLGFHVDLEARSACPVNLGSHSGSAWAYPQRGLRRL